MPSRRRRRLQQYAIAISIFSVFYNTAEGVVSIVFGAESSSRALVFYGLQSAVEVVSALLVTWRFFGVTRPGDEVDSSAGASKTAPHIIRIERIATTTIGVLLILLALAALATSAASLAAHDRPSTALPALLIAATATAFMLLLYLAKRYLARALDSSTLNGEALCALACMQLSVVLLVGSLVYRVREEAWWIDAATAIVIGMLFGWEGVKMVRWARSEAFDGGCCEGCHAKDKDEDERERTDRAPCGGCTTPTSGSGSGSTSTSDELGEKRIPSCSSALQCCGSLKKEAPRALDGQQAC